MAEIVRLHTSKQNAVSRVDETRSEPFKLLFFTGVRYERNTPSHYDLSGADVPIKPSTRKKVRKA